MNGRVPRETALGLIVVLAASLLAGRTLLAPGFYDSHDGLLNVHRLFEFEKCIADGQLPCRWVPDMGYGFGAPLFNFYPPLPTYVAEVFRLVGTSLFSAIKWTLLLSFAIGAAGAFGLAVRFFGASGGVLAAVLYTWAPYRAIDVFVRGALGEAFGLALLPVVFFTAERALADDGHRARWALGCVAAWCALLMTHNLVSLMAAPAYAFWCLLLWLRRKPDGALGPFVLAHALALGLAAHYVVPSLFEQQYTHAHTLTSLYDWARVENNFVDAGEVLLGTAWGYGPFRSPGGMSPFVGVLQWGMGTAALIAVATAWLRRRSFDDAAGVALLFGLTGWAAVAMTLPISRPLYELVPPLAFLQFPWRFLGVATLGFSVAAALCARAPGRIFPTAVAATGAVAAIVSGWTWFAPQAMHPVDELVLANEREIAKARHGLFDFMPAEVDLGRFPALPSNRPHVAAEGVDRRVDIRDVQRASNRVAFEAVVPGADPARVRVNVFRFPGWAATVDGERVAIVATQDPLARIHVDVPPGTHAVEVTFEDTAVRRVSNWVSGFAALAAGVFAIRAFRRGGKG